jgi:hypothetical protein
MLLLGVALVVPSSTGPVIALALCLPLLAAHEVMRGAAVVCDAVHVALVSDGVWLALVIGLTGIVEAGLVTVTPTAAVLVWAASGGVAALSVGGFFFVWGSEPGRRYLSRRFVGYRFLLEFLLMRATSQALILALGAVAGVVAVGAFRGATSLLGPLTVAVLSIANFGAPIAGRMRKEQWPRLASWGAVAVVAGVAVYTAFLVLLPSRWGTALLGASWQEAQPLLLPLAAMTASTGISAILTALIRLLEPRRTLVLRVAAAALMPPLFAAGYWMGGVGGAAWGLAVATAAQALMMAVQFRRLHGAARASSRHPAPTWR